MNVYSFKEDAIHSEASCKSPEKHNNIANMTKENLRKNYKCEPNNKWGVFETYQFNLRK